MEITKFEPLLKNYHVLHMAYPLQTDAPRAPDAAEQVPEKQRRRRHRGGRKDNENVWDTSFAKPPQRDPVPEPPSPLTAEGAHSPIGAAHARVMAPWRGMPFARWVLTPAVVRRQWGADVAQRFCIRETLASCLSI